MFSEPLRLKLGSEFNLNNVKVIEVTDEFLTLDKSIISCQNDESLEDCQTRKYVDTLVEHCNCLPFAIRESNSVTVLMLSFMLGFLFKRCIIAGYLCDCRPNKMLQEF